MNIPEDIKADNERAMRLLSLYMNLTPDAADTDTVRAITGGDASLEPFAVAAAVCGLDTEGNGDDKRIFRKYFIPALTACRASEFRNDPYYADISFPDAVKGGWKLDCGHITPYEIFACGDLMRRPDGRILPALGFFNESFDFPRVCQNGREWMTLMPNETVTMRAPAAHAHGRVLAFGLGLGYFAYLALTRPEVASVTVVERDSDVISLFREFILPQFPRRECVEIICGDAFEFADAHLGDGGYDYVFTDIWHDPSDGVGLYLEMKKRERLCPAARFEYWIEDTLKFYL